MTTATKQAAAFTIHGRLDGLNEYTRECRRNRYAGARMKERNELIVADSVMCCGSMRGVSFSGKVRITYKWYEQNRRRDYDNIAFAKKFIQDALVSCGVLAGDGWRHVAGFSDEFYVDKEKPRVEVEIREV